VATVLDLNGLRLWINHIGWQEVTVADYKAFTAMLGMGQITISTPTPTLHQPSNHRVIDKVAEFKKGTKRDAALYPTLKDNRHWNNWNRSVLAQAYAHDLKEFFDPSYKPDGEDEKELLKKKQCFTYAVLNRIIQTDEGKAFVRQHEKDYDAQEVYRKLLTFATKSTAAELAKDGLVKFLTTTKLDNCWNGSSVGFILH
jgi:hypothetical protein